MFQLEYEDSQLIQSEHLRTHLKQAHPVFRKDVRELSGDRDFDQAPQRPAGIHEPARPPFAGVILFRNRLQHAPDNRRRAREFSRRQLGFKIAIRLEVVFVVALNHRI